MSLMDLDIMAGKSKPNELELKVLNDFVGRGIPVFFRKVDKKYLKDNNIEEYAIAQFSWGKNPLKKKSSNVDYLLHRNGVDTLIECKLQCVGGTAIEKIPFEVWSLNLSKKDFIILIDIVPSFDEKKNRFWKKDEILTDDGFEWYNKEAKRHSKKCLGVFNYDDFTEWMDS